MIFMDKKHTLEVAVLSFHPSMGHLAQWIVSIHSSMEMSVLIDKSEVQAHIFSASLFFSFLFLFFFFFKLS